MFVASVYLILTGFALLAITSAGYPGRDSSLINSISSAIDSNYRCPPSSYRLYGASRSCLIGDAGTKPSIALLGNSHAQMYAPAIEQGLAKNKLAGLIIPLNGCLPTVDINISQDCLKMATGNYEALKNDSGIKTVVIAMTWYSDKLIDKGGNMIIIYALKALKEAGLLKDRQVIVIMHGDEESSGKPLSISRKDIIEAAQRSDIALCFETGTGMDYATIARRGSSSWSLTVKGKQAHSGGIFNKNTGAGSIYEASRIIHRFYDELQEQYLTFSPGIILGGTQVTMDSTGTEGTVSGKTNIVPNTTIVKGDLRFISEEQKNKAREKMRTIVKESLPQTEAEITFTDGSTYEYFGVNANVFKKFMSTDKPVRFAKRFIYDSYTYRKSKKAAEAGEILFQTLTVSQSPK
jgi:hypothetical protein